MLLNVLCGISKGRENNELTILVFFKRFRDFLLYYVIFGIDANIVTFKPLGIDTLQKLNITLNRFDEFFTEQAFFNRNSLFLDFVQINTKLIDAADFIKGFLDFLIIGLGQVSTLFDRNVTFFPPLDDVFIRGQNACKR